MAGTENIARLVSLACHDLRTPLATVFGFARTLEREPLGEPAARYVATIAEAAAQMTELLDELALVARIEGGRFEPALADVDSLALAHEAATELGEGAALVRGDGAPVRVDQDAVRHALARLLRAVLRHGGVPSLEVAVRGALLEIAPVRETAAPVVTGEEPRELGAAAALSLLAALGGSVALDGETLLLRLPE